MPSKAQLSPTAIVEVNRHFSTKPKYLPLSIEFGIYGTRGATVGARYDVKEWKMTTCFRFVGIAILLMGLALAGCRGGPSAWVVQTETRSLDVARTVTDEAREAVELGEVTALEVRTHNGSITCTGAPVGEVGTVRVIKKAGGCTHQDAEAAMAAIETFVEPAKGGSYRVGWRWARPRARTWSAKVSFEITVAEDVRLDLTTHNGYIDARGMAAAVTATSHNGRLILETKGDRLHAETHNGEIEATFSGQDVKLVTHNGSVQADLRDCLAPHGAIDTRNGAVHLIVGDDASTRLRANTANGRITCQLPLTDKSASRRMLVGTLGAGTGLLTVETHNGTIRIW